MTAAAQQNQQPRSLLSPTNLDADEAVLPDDPPMKALHPKLKLSPSPPPDIPSAQVSPNSILPHDLSSSTLTDISLFAALELLSLLRVLIMALIRTLHHPPIFGLCLPMMQSKLKAVPLARPLRRRHPLGVATDMPLLAITPP